VRIAGTHCGTTYARNVRGAGHGGASASGCLDHWTLRLDNDRPAFTSPRVRRVGSLTTSREHTYQHYKEMPVSKPRRPAMSSLLSMD